MRVFFPRRYRVSCYQTGLLHSASAFPLHTAIPALLIIQMAYWAGLIAPLISFDGNGEAHLRKEREDPNKGQYSSARIVARHPEGKAYVVRQFAKPDTRRGQSAGRSYAINCRIAIVNAPQESGAIPRRPISVPSASSKSRNRPDCSARTWWGMRNPG